MTITTSIGATVEVATTYDTALGFTVASNAASCVLTVSSAALAAGDYVEVTSGWGRLNGRIVRLSAATSTALTLEGVNTVSTALFPVGLGVGSVRKISLWTAMTQIKSLTGSGGDMQYIDTTSLNDVVAKQTETMRSVRSLAIEVFDDPALSWYTNVVAASDASSAYALKMTFQNGSKLVGNGLWSMDEAPTVPSKEALTTKINISYVSSPTRYAA